MPGDGALLPCPELTMLRGIRLQAMVAPDRYGYYTEKNRASARPGGTGCQWNFRKNYAEREEVSAWKIEKATGRYL